MPRDVGCGCRECGTWRDKNRDKVRDPGWARTVIGLPQHNPPPTTARGRKRGKSHPTQE